jgi:hypothetical protein
LAALDPRAQLIVSFFLLYFTDARVPFMVADGVVIIALHFIERGMKAEKALRELEADKAQRESRHSSNAEDRARKQATRDAQKQALKTNKNSTNGRANSKANIQQPKKTA